jgi:hypothetical protein
MEKKLESYDRAWVGIERPSFEDLKRKSRKIKIKKKKEASGKLEDMKLICDMSMRILGFLILLNLLVITSRFL